MNAATQLVANLPEAAKNQIIAESIDPVLENDYDLECAIEENPEQFSELIAQYAKSRVDEMNFSDKERDFIFSDWQEGDTHMTWLLTATRDEIQSWIDAGK